MAQLIGDAVRGLHPSCKRVAFISDNIAWVQELDGSIHSVTLQLNGTAKTYARTNFSDFDRAVSLHSAAIRAPIYLEPEGEEPEGEEPESYWPDNPRDQWGTY